MQKGDLNAIGDAVKRAIIEHLKIPEADTPAFALAFTLAQDRKEVLYIANVKRSDGVGMLRGALKQLETKSN